MKFVVVTCMLIFLISSKSKALSALVNRVLIKGFKSKQPLYMQKMLTTSAVSSQATDQLSKTNNQVIVLAGATSAGKSAVVRELTKVINAEIIIADSVQIYKYANIGANKPSIDEQLETPHHLVDLFEPSVILSSGEFVRLATAKVLEILEKGKTPIIVGGCTMWLDWLVHGIPDAPKASAEITLQANKVLEGCEERKAWMEALMAVSRYLAQQAVSSSSSSTAREIETNDISMGSQNDDNITASVSSVLPDRFNRLAANDWYRLRRYLEIELALRYQQQHQSQHQSQNLPSQDEAREPAYDLTSSSFPSSSSSSSLSGRRIGGLANLFIPSKTNHQSHSSSSSSTTLDVRCFFLSENRQDLYQTIDKRCVDMLHNGLLEEVTDMVLKNQMAGSNSDSSDGSENDDFDIHRNGLSGVETDIGISQSLTSSSSRPLHTLTADNSTIQATSAVTESMVAKAIGYRQTLDYLLHPHRYCHPNNDNTDSTQAMGNDSHSALENFVKEFSSATRNYAKRQLQWYRSDSAFLWLQIFRQSPSSSLSPPSSSSSSLLSSSSPYQAICHEMLHWINPDLTSPHDFQQLIQYQQECGRCVMEIRNRKRINNNSNKSYNNANNSKRKKLTQLEKLEYRQMMEQKYKKKDTTNNIDDNNNSTNSIDNNNSTMSNNDHIIDDDDHHHSSTNTVVMMNTLDAIKEDTVPSSSSSSSSSILSSSSPSSSSSSSILSSSSSSILSSSSSSSPIIQHSQSLSKLNNYNNTRQFYYYKQCVQSLIEREEVPVGFWDKELEKIIQLRENRVQHEREQALLSLSSGSSSSSSSSNSDNSSSSNNDSSSNSRSSNGNNNEKSNEHVPSYASLIDDLMMMMMKRRQTSQKHDADVTTTDNTHMYFSALDPVLRASEGLRSSAALMAYNQSFVVQQLLGMDKTHSAGSSSSSSSSNKGKKKRNNNNYSDSKRMKASDDDDDDDSNYESNTHDSSIPSVNASLTADKTFKSVLQRTNECVKKLNDNANMSDEAKLFIQAWRHRHLINSSTSSPPISSPTVTSHTHYNIDEK